MGNPRSSAARFTGDAPNSMPRPPARSGWVTTSLTRKPASASLSSVGTANSGVPQKTRSITTASPFPGFHQLADLAFHQIAFEGADVADVELAIEVVGLMQQGARQQVLARDLKGLTFQILRAGRDFSGAGNFLTELGK